MKSDKRDSSRWFLAASLVFGLAACGGGGGGGGSSATASIGGTIAVPSSGGPILEAEPNDTVDQAHFLGTLVAGQSIVVNGQVSPTDPVDGFKVVAPSRIQVTATLVFDVANDFDFGVFNLFAGDFVEVFATAAEPEVGVFHAQGTFLPVVEVSSGSGTYTLTLTATAPADPIAEREPNDLSSQGQYLGSITDGQTLRVSGTLDSATDIDDRILIDIPADVDLAASLTMPGGANFDVVYSDATPDILFPIELVRFNSLVANPETGTFTISGLTLLEVDMTAVTGSGAYTLTLTATAADDFAAHAREWHMGPASHELRQRFAKTSGPRFGSPVYESMPGELLVKPRAGREVAPELARRGLSIDAQVPGGVIKCVADVPKGASVETCRRRTLALVASFAACDSVEYVEPNFIRHICNTTPNDQFFNLQWHYNQIQLPAAWDITQGDNSIRIGVIDTGRTDHPDLVARLIPGFDFISNATIAADGNGVDADETDVGDGQGGQPSSFHGTHVAGTIGASTNNQIGVAGVTWFGKIMHLRVLGKGGGSDFDITQAVLYSAGLPNAATAPLAQPLDIINMSLGGPAFSQTFQNACTAARNAGVVIFAAAGNENSSVPSFPAFYDDVMSVAATDFNAARAPYSNHNSKVDIAAPGGDMTHDLNGDGFADGVLSTRVDDSVNPAVFNFEFENGTSMACPHAAGVAALIKAAALPTILTPAQIESFMITTATDLGAPGRDDFFGNGLINAFQAVLAASAGAPVNPVLGLSTQALSFPAGTSALDIQVSNLGGGVLHVSNPIAATDSGGPWLTATRVVATPGSSDTSAIAVSVDRTGLLDGAFTGTITVPSDGTNGSLVVQVMLVVDTSPAPENIDIFVVVVNALNFQSVAQDIVNPTSTLAYTVATLPAGSYFVFAGSDDDGDQFLGSAGDKYFGAFPTLDQPVAITVGSGQALPAVDFSVQTNFQGASTSTHHPLIRLQ